MSKSEQEGFKKAHICDVDEGYAAQRIDNFLRNKLKGVPKTRIYRMIRKGEVRVNKGRVKPDYKLKAGDKVRIPPVTITETAPVDTVSHNFASLIESSILYEDSALMVVNKPSGIAVHGGSGIKLGLIEALRQIRPEQKNLELVHRLDRDTSGCVMIAKKRSLLKFLHEQLRGDGVDKRYLALVVGRWPNRKQQVDVALQKITLVSGERRVKAVTDGKASITKFTVLQRYSGYTLVEVKPVTGRTHQIRVHCQYAGHPIAGDVKYGLDEDNAALKQIGLARLFLHAHRLTIPMPDSQQHMTTDAPLDPELQQFLSTLEKVD
jgi:23S rRNA pseudouridine955/2504/2580 synthase